MADLKSAIPKYLNILEKKKNPRFMQLGHKELDKKIAAAKKMLKRCELCEHKCEADRTKGELGFCRCPDKMEISSVFEHWGEERFLVPSFTIFFMGCSFQCVFCQNWTISQMVERGKTISPKELARIINRQHSKNVNFVGGDPVPYLPMILETLKYVDNPLPVVWNSNFYMSEKSMELLKDVVDIYLSDFKYGNNDCAKKLSNIDNYFDIVSRNHKLASEDSELVIRHLVLPNHLDCCTKKVFDFIAENFVDKAIVNIMDQYRPEYKAHEYKDINRPLASEEFQEALDYAEKLGLNYVM